MMSNECKIFRKIHAPISKYRYMRGQSHVHGQGTERRTYSQTLFAGGIKKSYHEYCYNILSSENSMDCD